LNEKSFRGHLSTNLRSGSWIGFLFGQVAWDDSALIYWRFRSMARVLGDWNIRRKAEVCLSDCGQFWEVKNNFRVNGFVREKFLEAEEIGSLCINVKLLRDF
jgi:hypothetical protein